MKNDTRLLRVATKQLSAEPEYIWQDDAACAFSDPELFETALAGQSRTAGMTGDGIVNLNYTNFNKADKICQSCPVLEMCRQETTADDRRYTFRAGLVPLDFTGNKPGRPTKAKNLKRGLPDTCSNGHFRSWRERKTKRGGEGRYCSKCSIERSKAHRDGKVT